LHHSECTDVLIELQNSISMNFLICIDNQGYEASLQEFKLYRALPDAAAEADGMVRVIDESGEDYLFSNSHFLDPKLDPSVLEALSRRTT